MKGLGELIRMMRGDVSYAVIARRTGLAPGFLAEIEAGSVIIFADTAQLILEQGLELPPRVARRLLQELRFTAFGLRKPVVRQILGETNWAPIRL